MTAPSLSSCISDNFIASIYTIRATSASFFLKSVLRGMTGLRMMNVTTNNKIVANFISVVDLKLEREDGFVAVEVAAPLIDLRIEQERLAADVER